MRFTEFYKPTTEIENIASELYALDREKFAENVVRWIREHIEYRPDTAIGYREYFQSPVETLRMGAGDCEDMAFLAASILRAKGLPAYVVVGYRKGGNSYHAWVDLDGLVIDPAFGFVGRSDIYIPVFRITEYGIEMLRGDWR